MAQTSPSRLTIVAHMFRSKPPLLGPPLAATLDFNADTSAEWAGSPEQSAASTTGTIPKATIRATAPAHDPHGFSLAAAIHISPGFGLSDRNSFPLPWTSPCRQLILPATCTRNVCALGCPCGFGAPTSLGSPAGS